MTIETATSKAPTHFVYNVREGSEKSYWTRIGAAWAHKDNKGFTITLDSVPCIVLKKVDSF